MAEWRYEMMTNMPRDFNPEIEGETLDSIMEACSNVIDWWIPLSSDETRIIFDAKRQLSTKDIRYFSGQLSAEFDYDVLSITRIREGERDSAETLNVRGS